MTENQHEQKTQPEQDSSLAFTNESTAATEDTSRKLLKDIANQLAPYLEETCDQGLLSEYKRIQTLFGSASFSVTVAGSFCRGKSTLINRLLETELPTGDLPTTTVLTHIEYGPESKLWFCIKNDDNTYSRKELDTFYPTEEITPEIAQSGYYLYQVPLIWLDQKQLEFIDTPGMDDTETFREQLATEAVRSSDAVLLVVGATTPLSISERTYLEEHVYSTRVPRVAIVITMIDRVPVKERPALAENIRTRIQSWYPQAEIWLAEGHDDSNIETPNEYSIPVGVDSMRSGIDRWASDPEHSLARTDQIKTQLENLLNLYLNGLQTRINVFHKTQEEKEEYQQTLKRKLDADALLWNDLELEMDSRGLKIGTVLQEQLYNKEKEMTQSLQKELDKAVNPALWWEQEFPFQVSRCFGEIASLVGNSITTLVESDFRWLNQEALKQTGNWTEFIQSASIPLPTETNGAGISEQLSVDNLQSKQLMKRVGFAVAGTGAYLFFGPIGPIVAASFAYISERKYKAETDEQKETIRNEISKFVPYLFQKISDKAKQVLQQKYVDAVKHIRDEKKQWYNAQLEAIKADSGKEADEAEFQCLQKQLDEIKTLQLALVQVN
ncbi:MAG: dynamin family protein [Planctomycetia bacterium]|nr:dynamin family protein [Planctomycetia bacterium]